MEASELTGAQQRLKDELMEEAAANEPKLPEPPNEVPSAKPERCDAAEPEKGDAAAGRVALVPPKEVPSGMPPAMASPQIIYSETSRALSNPMSATPGRVT